MKCSTLLLLLPLFVLGNNANTVDYIIGYRRPTGVLSRRAQYENMTGPAIKAKIAFKRPWILPEAKLLRSRMDFAEWSVDVIRFPKNQTESCIRKLQDQRDVLFIEPDEPMTAAAIQNTPPWGLARISNLGSTSPSFVDGRTRSPYHYPSNAGKNVTVYILDTGLEIHHPEFKFNNPQYGPTFTKFTDKSPFDLNGHGTHCSGTAVGQTVGVAKAANLVSLRVCDTIKVCYYSNILGALEYVVQTAKRPSVVSISITGSRKKFFDRAIRAATQSGIYVIVAAGNDIQDARIKSPASCPDAFTVGAVAEDNTFASFSNYGRCVNILAPGVSIRSAFTNNTYALWQGTSMATPHVAGVMASILSRKSFRTVKEGYAYLSSLAVRDVIQKVPFGTPNLLLYNGYNTTDGTACQQSSTCGSLCCFNSVCVDKGSTTLTNVVCT